MPVPAEIIARYPHLTTTQALAAAASDGLRWPVSVDAAGRRLAVFGPSVRASPAQPREPRALQ
eukprot:4975517-Pleurochrysis_carterae.AAC.1